MQLAKPANWMRWVMGASAAYNLLLGAGLVLFPETMRQILGVTGPPHSPALSSISLALPGIAALAFCVGYAVAAANPYQQWAIVAAGLAAKLMTPILFVHSVNIAHVPLSSAWIIVVNDLIWWLPFSLILSGTYRAHVTLLRNLAPEVLQIALRAKTQGGVSLQQLSQLKPVLIVFLRHAGCTFCREALSDLSRQKPGVEAADADLVLVHMSSYREGEQCLAKYGLQGTAQISDPHCSLYRAFGLRRGTLKMLFGPKTWVRGFEAGILRGHGVGGVSGDGFQMPGMFLVYHGQVIRSYRHQSAADRPNYERFVREDHLARMLL